MQQKLKKKCKKNPTWDYQDYQTTHNYKKVKKKVKQQKKNLIKLSLLINSVAIDIWLRWSHRKKNGKIKFEDQFLIIQMRIW